MIDHTGVAATHYDTSKQFYLKALAPLGYTLIKEVQENQFGAKAAGFGAKGKPDFWIGGEGALNKPLHIAIATRERAAVDAIVRSRFGSGTIDCFRQ